MLAMTSPGVVPVNATTEPVFLLQPVFLPHSYGQNYKRARSLNFVLTFLPEPPSSL